MPFRGDNPGNFYGGVAAGVAATYLEKIHDIAGRFSQGRWEPARGGMWIGRAPFAAGGRGLDQ